MIYVILIVALVFGLGGAYGGYSWEAGRWAQEKVKQEAAQSMIEEQGRQLAQETANHEADMATAYEAGQSKAKTVYVKVQQRGASDVANNAVFSNRACDWPAAGVLLVRSAFANLRTPADTSIPDAAVSIAPAIPGGPAGSNLPVATQPAGTMVPVHPDARPVSGGGEIPGTGTARPPKPTPRATK